MKINLWQNIVPWFLTIASTITLIAIGVFLLNNINWFKQDVFNSEIVNVNHPEYRIYAYHLHLSIVKRSIGFFTGIAICFLGLGVALYTLKTQTTMDTDFGGLKAKLITASPGLVALLIGSIIIISTIISKDSFPAFIPLTQESVADSNDVELLYERNLPDLPDPSPN